MQTEIEHLSNAGAPNSLTELITLGRTLTRRAGASWPTSTTPTPQAAPPKPSTHPLKHLRESALELAKPHQLHHPSTPRNRRIQTPTTPPIMKNHKSEITRRRRTSSRPGAASWGAHGHLRRSPGVLARYVPSGPRWRAISRHTTEGPRPIEQAIHTWDKPASNPAIIAARSSTLNIRRQLTTNPSNSTATTQIAYTL